LTSAIVTAKLSVFPYQETTHMRKDIIVESEYLDSLDLEKLTGTAASTWRYWATIGQGPASFKLGRRRVWKRDVVLAWLEHQEAATA
jgi:predicted DNA-binding transcriptional regulator AlpA